MYIHIYIYLYIYIYHRTLYGASNITETLLRFHAKDPICLFAHMRMCTHAHMPVSILPVSVRPVLRLLYTLFSNWHPTQRNLRWNFYIKQPMWPCLHAAHMA